jgi:uncharacterized damage-inducible protein DinB
MMAKPTNEAEHILEHYDLAMNGDGGYSEEIWKILDGISPSTAAATPVAGAHSIWQLVKHMAFWERVGLQRAAGPVTPDEKLNFPSTPTLDEQAWEQTLDEFRRSNHEFREFLAHLDPAKLDQNTPGGQRTFRTELLDVIRHHIYHAGQIALLKKAVALQPAGRL